MVRYYGFYKSCGLRKKVGTDDDVPVLIETDVSRKEFRKNWVQLIQKIYNADPLLYPKCQGVMKIISSIEDKDVIEKMLRHLACGRSETMLLPPGMPNVFLNSLLMTATPRFRSMITGSNSPESILQVTP